MSIERFIPIEVNPTRNAPSGSANEQDTLASKYPLWVKLLAMTGFTLAFIGWLNETWLFLWESPIWMNRYTEYAIIFAFGLWRIIAEKNPYTKRRLIILVSVVTVLWWLIPWLWPFFEPYAGYLWAQPVFPSLHAPGTLTFFLVLGLVLLFGRRVICGFGCPCVGIRETVGFPFRHLTIRGDWANRLRHIKWIFFVWYVGVLVVTQFPPTGWTTSFVGFFGLLVALTYFGSFYLIPITGNRFYCRSLCPFGATFGVLNHAGLYDLRMDTDKCIDCARCEQACDMGIPVMREGKAHGHVKRIEDCMGCGRCVIACPTDALEIRDVRNFLRPGLRQNASHLLKLKDIEPLADRQTTSEYERLSLAQIKLQASRCVDCGEPACRKACPLQNRIPEWLALAKQGEMSAAADLIQTTNPLPEFCGQLCPKERLCEGACARELQGVGAVAIGAVEHSVIELAYANGWKPKLFPDNRSSRKAATIGAGPASLSFAEFLNREGWQVTVYDRDQRIGGMLSSGLPDFRFDKSALERRRLWMEQSGIQFKLGSEINQKEFTRIHNDNDVVFVGVGARAPKEVEFPGQDLEQVTDAISFLEEFNLGSDSNSFEGRDVIVLGGGDSAMDCARAAKRCGARSVKVTYRGSSENMRASLEERALTMADGVELVFNHNPAAIEGTGAVSSILFDVEGASRSVKCNQVILALGQQGSAPDWLSQFGVELDQGQVIVDSDGRTSASKLYAGGDCSYGPDLISTAAAAGRRAAISVCDDSRALSTLRKKSSTKVVS